MFIIIIILLILFVIITFKKQNKLQVIVTTYNPGAKFIERCLKSIEKQTFKNYDVCILDDSSTKEVIETHNIILKYCKKHNWKYIFRKSNIGPLGARIECIDKLKPNNEDIVVSIDGDDMLNNDNVFAYIDNVYKDNTMMTFGNYVDINMKGEIVGKPKLNCIKYNFDEITKNNSFRDIWIFTHLKTFKYKLYKKINHNDLKLNGKYFTSSTDRALMYPMIEMCGGKFKCIDKVLYNYTREHPESNNIVSNKFTEQSKNAEYIKNMPKYKKLF